MRLYIQQLEEQIRQLTGENERLAYEVNQLRSQLGMAPLQGEPTQTGAVTGQDAGAPPAGPGSPPQDLGTLSVAPNDPLIAPDGAGAGGPVDLAALAGAAVPEFGNPVPSGQGATQDGTQVAGLPTAPSPTTALSGSPRDEYDLAYGYILTGDYDLAEQSFQAWLEAFPSDPQAADARFWLGESHLQQGEYSEAANTFLSVYRDSPDSNKGPDALVKLGVSLAALGERDASCATFSEVARRYPNASSSLLSRVHDEEARAGC